jgi:PAS domain S-box-containing protein
VTPLGWHHGLALGAGLLFTLGGLAAGLLWGHAEQRERFRLETTNREHLLTARLQGAGAAIASLETLFTASKRVDADEFRLLATDLMDRWSFLRAALYAPRLQRPYGADYAAAVAEEGLPGFRIWGGTEQGDQYPLRYLEPFTPLAARWLGYDLGAHPGLMAALDGAAPQGRLVAAPGPFGEAVEYWLVQPLHGNRGQPTAAQPEPFLKGLVGVALDPAALVQGLAPTHPGERLRLGLLGAPGAPELPMFEAPPPAGGPLRISHHHEIPFGGQWLVVAFDRDLSWPELAGPQSAVALALGLLLTLLLLTLAAKAAARQEAASALRQSHAALSEERARLEERVRERTADLALSEARLRATLEHSPTLAIQWYDEAGRVTYWNPASARLFGWPADEARGQTLDALMLAPGDAAEFQRILAGIRRTGEPYGPYEVAARTRDGGGLWLLSSIFAIPLEEGRGGFVCTDVDISARRRAEEVLRRSRASLNEAQRIACIGNWELDLGPRRPPRPPTGPRACSWPT